MPRLERRYAMPAWARQSASASWTAVEVIVAPETASIEPFSTICWAKPSPRSRPMPCVSLDVSTEALTTAPPLTPTLTVTSPMPTAVAVYTASPPSSTACCPSTAPEPTRRAMMLARAVALAMVLGL